MFIFKINVTADSTENGLHGENYYCELLMPGDFYRFCYKLRK